MIGEFFIGLLQGALALFPVLSLPLGFAEGLNFFISIVGFVNIFVPLIRLAPIVGLIVLVRNWRIAIALLRFILRFIPFLDGS